MAPLPTPGSVGPEITSLLTVVPAVLVCPSKPVVEPKPKPVLAVVFAAPNMEPVPVGLLPKRPPLCEVCPKRPPPVLVAAGCPKP